ncbi:MAG: hypothetical protein MJE68_18310 [Proteobacteria bacterium]|nr:hypothetical protein [Pseudomonadota bacterium]
MFVLIANLDHMEAVVVLEVVEGVRCIVDSDYIGFVPHYIESWSISLVIVPFPGLLDLSPYYSFDNCFALVEVGFAAYFVFGLDIPYLDLPSLGLC